MVLVNYWLVMTTLEGMANSDFMSLYAGGRSLVLNQDPYNPGAWAALRARFGSRWFPDPTCPFPLWTLIFFAPLSLLPLPVAASVWITICELGLVASVFLLLALTRREGSPVLTCVALFGALVSRPFLASLINGQVVPAFLPILAGAAWLYSRGRSLLFGVLLSLLITKPNLFILFFPAVALLLFARRDWNALAGLALGAGLLLFSSWAISPGWPYRWVRVIGDKAFRFSGTPTLWGLAYVLFGDVLWAPAAVAGVVLLSSITMILVLRWQDDWLAAMGLTLCASLLTAHYLRAYDHTLIIVPMIVGLGYGRDHLLTRVSIWLGVILALPWLLFRVAQVRGFDQWSALVPVAAMVYLYVARRKQPIPAWVSAGSV
ncbi:MAG: glycosyltransferase family 87 protein [Anaerolineae bacterium]